MIDYRELFESVNAYERLEALKNNGELFAEIPELKACFACEQENPHHCYNVGEHIFISVREALSSGESPMICMALLLHDICKPYVKTFGKDGNAHFYDHAVFSSKRAAEILRKVDCFSGEEKERIVFLIDNHDVINGSAGEKTLQKLLRRSGYSFCSDLLTVKYYDIMAQSEFRRNEKLGKLNYFRNIVENSKGE